MSERGSAYRAYARPEVARRLEALGLDVAYYNARGDHLVWVDDAGEHEVVDLVGGYGATLFGHHHPALVAAMREALDWQLPIHAQASIRTWAGELARRLSDRIGAATGASYVTTLCNSGAEAVEAALKHAELARAEDADDAERWWRRRAQTLLASVPHAQPAFLREVSRELGLPAAVTLPQALDALGAANAAARRSRPVFLALEDAFHGKTSGATQVTYNASFREPFARIGVATEFLPVGDEDAWARAIARATVRTWRVRMDGERLLLEPDRFVNVSAILVEPIQGEGGVHELTPAHAAHLRALADANGVPLVVDEIQCGLGRAGTFLASEAIGLRGDYYALSKALGGGLAKIGALVVDRRLYRPEFGLKHTSTFAEDDLSSRVAVAALELIDRDDVPGRCARLGERLLAGLRRVAEEYPDVVAAVRGRGLMVGVELRPQDHGPSNVLRMLSDQGYQGYAVAAYLLREEGFRVMPTVSAPDTLRLEPSAYVDPAHLDRFCEALARACRILRFGDAARLTRHLVGQHAPPTDAPPRDYRGSGGRLRREAPRCPKRVAFISHMIVAADAVTWDPSLATLGDAIERYQLASHRILGPTVYDRVHVTSALGETVHLDLYGLNLTSRSIEKAMRSGDKDWIVRMIEEAAARAREDGCQVVGLGAYTSILTDNGRRLAEPTLAVTTGNSLTVGTSLAAVRRAAAARGIELGRARIGVVGATGNIGSVAATMLAEECAELVLVGRERSDRLDRVAAGLTGGARVSTTVDLRDLSGCQVVIAASNSASPVILPEHLGDHPTVVCDIAVPRDVSPEVARLRPNAHVIQGGLVRIPNDPAFRIGGVPLPDGLAYACMAETLVLGLMGVRQNYSHGALEPARVRQVTEWATLHGFVLGDDKIATGRA